MTVWCRNTACEYAHEAPGPHDAPCPACGWRMTNDPMGLPMGHPAREPYDHPTPRKKHVHGTVVGVRLANRTKPWSSLSIRSGDATLIMGVPKVLQHDALSLEGCEIELDGLVTMWRPWRGKINHPTNIRVLEEA